MPESELVNLLEEMNELVDIHQVNANNLEKIGGFKILMEIMFKS